MKFPDNDLVI